MDKLKQAFYWAVSCDACEFSILDIDEKILNVLRIVLTVF